MVTMANDSAWDPAGGPASAEWFGIRRQWAGGWRRAIFPGVFLIILLQTAAGVAQHSSGIAAVAGYVVLAAFCVGYLFALPAAWDGRQARFWTLCGVLVALMVVELAFAHEDAFVMAVFIAVLTVGGLRWFALPVIAALAVVVVGVPPAIGSWHAAAGIGNGASIVMVSLAMFGFFSLVRSNYALNEARTEIARLAAENERSRIARDLHDLLGHSLTSITLKAGLARRVAASDPERAAEEIADVEELARTSLVDVRAAVGGYREVTLAGELATGRQVVRAAGITGVFPTATDMVDPSNQELFGWVVREGLTNTVRHARAKRCSVTVGADWVEVVDDGHGGCADLGNGLSGLRERVEAVGGRVQAGPSSSGAGWRLRVDVPPGAAAACPTASR